MDLIERQQALDILDDYSEDVLEGDWYSSEKFRVTEKSKYQRMMERLEASNGSEGVSGK